jgi:hypothetical protein
VPFSIGDLGGKYLGLTAEREITIDATAAGWGWQRMDLLTVVLHELGHVLGLEDEDGDELMGGTLGVGVSHGIATVLGTSAPRASLLIAATPRGTIASSRATIIRLDSSGQILRPAHQPHRPYALGKIRA